MFEGIHFLCDVVEEAAVEVVEVLHALLLVLLLITTENGAYGREIVNVTERFGCRVVEVLCLLHLVVASDVLFRQG